jgi:hypothetical protein
METTLALMGIQGIVEQMEALREDQRVLMNKTTMPLLIGLATSVDFRILQIIMPRAWHSLLEQAKGALHVTQSIFWIVIVIWTIF